MAVLFFSNFLLLAVVRSVVGLLPAVAQAQNARIFEIDNLTLLPPSPQISELQIPILPPASLVLRFWERGNWTGSQVEQTPTALTAHHEDRLARVCYRFHKGTQGDRGSLKEPGETDHGKNQAKACCFFGQYSMWLVGLI